jgi:hypothetical protein
MISTYLVLVRIVTYSNLANEQALSQFPVAQAIPKHRKPQSNLHSDVCFKENRSIGCVCVLTAHWNWSTFAIATIHASIWHVRRRTVKRYLADQQDDQKTTDCACINGGKHAWSDATVEDSFCDENVNLKRILRILWLGNMVSCLPAGVLYIGVWVHASLFMLCQLT